MNSPHRAEIRLLVQSMHAGVPLLTRDVGSGKFKQTIGIRKAADLSTPFAAFPFTVPDTAIGTQGKLECVLTVPGNAAFFRAQAQ